MNEILQQRIEEAANTTVQNLYDYARQGRNPKVSAYSEGYLDAIDTQGEFLFKEGANYALSNQWISVEEALPKEKFDDGYQFVFVRIHLYDDTFYYDTDYIRKGKWELHKNQEITHWMPIPSLEGGEE